MRVDVLDKTLGMLVYIVQIASSIMQDASYVSRNVFCLV